MTRYDPGYMTGGDEDPSTYTNSDPWTYGGQAAAYDANGNKTRNSTAEDAVDLYRILGGAWGPGGESLNYEPTQADYGPDTAGQMAAQSRTDAYDAIRGQYDALDMQDRAMGMYRDAATGGVPSRAAVMSGSMIDQASLANAANAASFRGTGSGLAARAAMMGGQGAYGGVMGNAADMASQERINAMQGYAGAANAYTTGAGGIAQSQMGLRRSDLDLAGQDIGRAQFQGQQALAAQQLALQGQLGYEKLAYGVNRAQLEAAQARQQVRSSGHSARQGIASQDETAGLSAGFTEAGRWRHGG